MTVRHQDRQSIAQMASIIAGNLFPHLDWRDDLGVKPSAIEDVAVIAIDIATTIYKQLDGQLDPTTPPKKQ